ncbi:hypothetical protein AHF37_06481 [Paragonimus kellicotti]|nr:hypothetical protein AHF37_06481 [Paragonimus kellicotti]
MDGLYNHFPMFFVSIAQDLANMVWFTRPCGNHTICWLQ